MVDAPTIMASRFYSFSELDWYADTLDSDAVEPNRPIRNEGVYLQVLKADAMAVTRVSSMPAVTVMQRTIAEFFILIHLGCINLMRHLTDAFTSPVRLLTSRQQWDKDCYFVSWFSQFSVIRMKHLCTTLVSFPFKMPGTHMQPKQGS